MSEALVPYVDMQNMAKAIATSGLFGIKTPEQALALMLIAQAEGLHPAIAARDYDIIGGRPAKKSEAMMRSYLLAGGSVQWHKLSDTEAEATFSHPQGGTLKLEWSIDRAKKAGLYDKQNRDGSPNMWHKYPRRMLSARILSEGIRTICPLATSGLYTPEEADDMSDGSEINIETRRRTGHGYTREQLPEAVETKALPPESKPPVHETKPGVYEPNEQSVAKTAIEWFRLIEIAADVETLNKIGVELQTANLSGDDKKTARQLFAARKKELNSPQPPQSEDGGHVKGAPQAEETWI